MNTLTLSAALVAFVASFQLAHAEEYLIEIPTDTMAKHYVLNVEQTEKNRVQIENRREGKYETLYGVLLVDCSKRTAMRVHEGSFAASVFPVVTEKKPTNPLIEGSIQWHLAKHACEKSGIKGAW